MKDLEFLANVSTWREAVEECETLGGYLAEITHEDQQKFLVNLRFKPDGAATESSSNRERIVRNPADRSFGI